MNASVRGNGTNPSASVIGRLMTTAWEHDVAIGLVFDPKAPAGEAWTATVGLDGIAAAASPLEAVLAAIEDSAAEVGG